jgi:hypothetical protein
MTESHRLRLLATEQTQCVEQTDKIMRASQTRRLRGKNEQQKKKSPEGAAQVSVNTTQRVLKNCDRVVVGCSG